MTQSVCQSTEGEVATVFSEYFPAATFSGAGKRSFFPELLMKSDDDRIFTFLVFLVSASNHTAGSNSEETVLSTAPIDIGVNHEMLHSDSLGQHSAEANPIFEVSITSTVPGALPPSRHPGKLDFRLIIRYRQYEH